MPGPWPAQIGVTWTDYRAWRYDARVESTPRIAAVAGSRVRDDPRGMPYVTTTVRITGPAHLAILAELCQRTGQTPAALSTELVNEELRYIGIPGARDQVRRTRAARRALYDPHRDTR
jgi:hypothetical protein